MKKITRFTGFFAVVAVAVLLSLTGTALAQDEGCPSLSGKLESEIVGAYFTVGGNQANYYFGSLENRYPKDGVPGLIKYCVYPGVGPASAGVAYPGWKLLGFGGKNDDPEFAFGRIKGDPTNIPLDGREDILIGYATWSDGVPVPEVQTILLHINDPVECHRLYGGNPGTCWVLPSSKWPPQNGEETKLNVIKFYDANANGINDDGQLIEGWKIDINGSIFYTPYSEFVEPGEYTVTEFYPNEPNWMPTTPKTVTVTLLKGEEKTVEFGNLCIGWGNGRTLGFWSNRNGQALFGADDLAYMVSLNLRTATGAHFDPASYTAFRTWLLSATATNMAYMLSAQLAAMALNVFNGFVNEYALIYAPGTTSANALGFATVKAIIAEANAELGLHGTAYSGDAWRPYQEALKNALDWANNNQTFVQPTPCYFSFAE